MGNYGTYWIQMQHYLWGKKKKKTFANAMASQPAKLNNTENHIACITISTGI